jgi:hypothetical protein
MRFTQYIIWIAELLLFILSLVTNWYEPIVYAINIVAVLMVLDKLGKGIVLREIVALHSVFICLLMPLMGYLVYNRENYLAVVWVRYMPVPKEVYFDFCLPAVIGFCIILCWPMTRDRSSDTGPSLKVTLEKIKTVLRGNQKLGIYLLIVGVAMSVFINYFPASMQYVGNLFYLSAFAGLLYVNFAGSFNYKKIILILFGAFIVALALRDGMFTIIAYMGMTLFSFFFVGKKSSLLKKVLYFVVAALVLIIIQNVKPEYRKLVWRQKYEGSKAALFARIVSERVTSSKKFVTAESFFFLYYRANQGFNMSLVMRRFPDMVPFDNGSKLGISVASSFIPRLFWPDKPTAGGLENMKYYAGTNIKGWATNVGPLGEAYASFGFAGGIFYMMVLGWFIRFAYQRLFIIARKNLPLTILWIPVMFFQVAYSAENDTLQILNSLLKSAFFIFVLYKIIPKLLKPSPYIAVVKNKMSFSNLDKAQTSLK